MPESQSPNPSDDRAARPPDHGENPPIMRSLGAFFGEIWKGIKTDPVQGGGTRRVVSKRVEEEPRDTSGGPVIIRRTIIEEVEIPGPVARPKPNGEAVNGSD